MNPAKVVREKVRRLTDLPNIGPAGARDLEQLGITQPSQLVGADPLHLYDALCRATGEIHDPCLLDVFMSVTHFMAGGNPQPWWHFTDERKRRYGTLLSATPDFSVTANNSST
jgi:hypothetical protein